LPYRRCRNTPSSPLQAAQYIPWCFGGDEELLGETDITGTFEALQQFHAPQTVETDIALERTIHGNGQRTALMRMQLNGKLPNCLQYSIY
jgi:hypothetical protein